MTRAHKAQSQGKRYRVTAEERVAPRAPVQMPTLPAEGLVRLKTVLALVPVGESTWWAGVKAGRFPKPVAIGLKTRAWRANDIRKLLDSFQEADAQGIPLPTREPRAAALEI